MVYNRPNLTKPLKIMKLLTEEEFNNILTELVNVKDFNTHCYILADGTYKTIDMYNPGHGLKHVYQFYNFYEVDGYFDNDEDDTYAERYDNDEKFQAIVHNEIQELAHDNTSYVEYVKAYKLELPELSKEIKQNLIMLDLYPIANNDAEGDLTCEVESRFSEELNKIEIITNYNVVRALVKACKRSLKYYKTVSPESFTRRVFNSYANNYVIMYK